MKLLPRRYAVYAIHVTDPETGRPAVGHIEHTVDDVEQRVRARRYGCPRTGAHPHIWADTATGYTVLNRAVMSGRRADRLVLELVRVTRPLYNDELNEQNPRWIPAWRRAAQRAERDRACGREAKTYR